MLNQASILIAEDEPFIALDLALAVEDAGGEVVGPAASVREALEMLDRTSIKAAILDVNLTDGIISPVAEKLIGRGIPFILQTGVGLPAELMDRVPALIVCIKPCIASRLVGQLAVMIAEREAMEDDSLPRP